uniref:Histone-lysine N-methyltransferase ATX2 n=1 Tax=Anthurium amnicola TaxID=1678845 RepID=A0A1D1XRD8_9ARAE
MDDAWQIKCGTAWPPQAAPSASPAQPPPPSMVAASRFLPPASGIQMDVNLNPKVRPFVSLEANVEDPAFAQEPMSFSSLNTGSCKPSKTEMGNSFLALLSGPSQLFPCEFRQLPKSGSSSSTSKLPACAIANAASGVDCSVTVPFMSALSVHRSGDSTASGAEHSPYSMSRLPTITACSQPIQTPIFCNDLQVLGSQFSTSGAGKPVTFRAHPGNERGLAVSPTNNANHNQHQKLNARACPIKQLDAGINTSSHASSFIRGCPRVFCMGKVGELFVSDNGLLGVFCLCHSLRMSVAKFCEHSGSHVVNPGDAVCLENGETVAQWRRLFFLNIGVRVPDDGSGWDWPDVTFMPGSLIRSKANNLPNSKSIEAFQLQEPLAETGRYQGLPNSHTSLYPYMGTSSWEKLLSKFQGNTEHRNSHEGVHKSSIGSTHCDSSVPVTKHRGIEAVKENHAFLNPSILKPNFTTEEQNSGNKLIAHNISVPSKAGNFSTIYPSSWPVKSHGDFCSNGTTISSNTHVLDRDSTSNIELRLGQPSRQNHSFVMSTTSATCPQQYFSQFGPQKQPMHQLISQGSAISRVPEKPMQNLYCAPSQVVTSNGTLSRHAFGNTDVIHVPEQDVAKADVDKNSLISLFLSNFSTSEGKTKSQFGENFTSRTENSVPNLVGCNSLSAKWGMIDFSRNANSGIERKTNMNMPEFSSQREKGKGQRDAIEDEFYTAKSYTNFQNKQAGDLISFVESSDGHSCHNTYFSDRQNSASLHQSFSKLLEEPDAEQFKEFGETSLRAKTDINNGYRSATTASLLESPVSTFFPSNPICISGPKSSGSSKVNIDTRHFVDGNMRFPALKHLAELSNQAHLPASLEMSLQQGQSCHPSTMGTLRKGSKEDLLATNNFRCGQHYSTLQDASRFAFRTLHSCCNCCSCGVAENLCGNTGIIGTNRICNQTGCIQDISPYSKESHVKSASCPACNNDEQSFLRLFRTNDKITELTESEMSGQKQGSIYVPDKCSCSIRSKCLKGCHIFWGEGHPNPSKEYGACGKSHMLLAPAYDMDHVSQDGKRVALGQCDGSRHVIMNDDGLSALGRDIPSMALGNADTITIQSTTEVLPAAGSTDYKCVETAAKNFVEFCEETDSIKEQRMSDIYSACSAPVVTEVSVEENNMDSCIEGSRDTRSVFDVAVDEGSLIEKCGSSDDVLDNTRWDKTVAVEGKVDPQKVSDYASYHTSRNKMDETNQQSGDFINELNLGKSFIPRKKIYQFQDECAVKEMNKDREPVTRGWRAGRKKKATKWRRLDGSFTASGLSLIHQHSTNRNDYLKLQDSSKGMESPGHPGKMTQRVCLSSSKSSDVKHESYALPYAEPHSSRISDSHRRVCKDDVQMQSVDSDSSNRMSKAPSGTKVRRNFTADEKEVKGQEKNPELTENLLKIIPCSIKGCFPGGNCPQDRMIRPVVRGNSGIICNGNLSGKSKPVKIVSLNSVLRLAKRCNISENEKDPRRTSNLQMQNAGCFSLKGETHEFSVTKRENDTGVGTLKSNFNAHLKPRSKETRKRRLSEITGNPKDAKDTPCLPTFGESQCFKSMQAECHLKKSVMAGASDDLVVEHNQHKRNQARQISKCSELPRLRSGKNPPEGHDYAVALCHANDRKFSNKGRKCQQSILDSDAFCSVCGSSNKDDVNYLLECNSCLIRVHQACYGVSKVPKGQWCCRPCRTNSKNIACVLCGYEDGAMTRAVRSQTIVKSLLKTWKVGTGYLPMKSSPLLAGDHAEASNPCFKVHNSITAGALDPTVTQWVHVVCGLWTPGTRCPNVDTMSAFDVSGVLPSTRMVCSLCKRSGGSCIRCRVVDCAVRFHPWCAHQKGLLQSEIEGVDNENVGFYGRCLLHATHHNYHSEGIPMDDGTECPRIKEFSCARTEGYKGRKKERVFLHTLRSPTNDNGRCIVPQEQLNAWLHINGQKSCARRLLKPPASETDYDCRKEYARYKQMKGWMHLVVYKSRIHALGLYTSQFIPRGAMVVEYVGEIVGLRVADKREIEYQSGKKLQYKSACYFFRIDKEHIIDATRKGGIARFVNHSCLPNCAAKVISVRNEKKVVFFAERDINPGEEITYDYHFNHEEEGKKIPCFCNSKNCRRYLN